MAVKLTDSDGVQYFNMYPGERKDYTAMHAAWLDTSSDTIVSAVFSSLNVGLEITSASFTTSTHTCWISPSAGNANTKYNFVSKIFTAGDRIDTLKFRIKVGS